MHCFPFFSKTPRYFPLLKGLRPLPPFQEKTPAYIKINAAKEGIWVEFERRSNTTLVFLLSNYPQVLKILYD